MGKLLHIKTCNPEDSAGQSGQLVKVGAEYIDIFIERLNEFVANGEVNHYPCAAYDVLFDKRALVPIFTNGRVWLENDTYQDYMNAIRLYRVFRKKMDSAKNVDSKKIKDKGGLSIPAEKNPVVMFVKFLKTLWWVISKSLYYLKRRELPWRLRWIPIFIKGFQTHPVPSLLSCIRLATSRISYINFNLKVFGPEILKLIFLECEKAGLHPFLVWGTLLGCVREGNFIDNDSDIDLGLMDSEFNNIDLLISVLSDIGFKLIISNKYKVSFLYKEVNGLTISFDRVYLKNDQFVISNERTSEHGSLFSYYFPVSLFESFVEAELNGVKVTVPTQAEKFLEIVYKEWKIPVENDNSLYAPLNLRIEKG